MTFQSSSQFGQDRFPYELIYKESQNLSGLRGFFVDIGCGDPVNLNNSYGLEKIGWTGILNDAQPVFQEAASASRSSKFILGNAQEITWAPILPGVVDYLSIDCDDFSAMALGVMPFDTTVFRTLTIEHDYYRTAALRAPIRDLLHARGYDLLCADVCWNGGQSLEDWWVHPLWVNMERAEKIRCINLEWSEIFRPLE